MTNGQQLAIEHGTITQAGKAWVPHVYVERDPEAEEALESEYGRPVPSGYMSEECGWDFTDDEEVVRALAIELGDDLESWVTEPVQCEWLASLQG